ncbi:hypothetical protein EN817_28345 [Mesorhizobium sp. M3A.F.Ca.ET.174.01.1.1]|nr:hypothetical protein EJ074_05130 [Mesorhizobium sp. M3A.F.Ca.ET.080.04.2.1]RWB71831.1 MAG: hypothetical protein EOQ49_14340 [Mesorhizobium sp.]TGS82339.1 hypothetical protein EN818_27795 [Mesorhizobium sp. M3A.F.Ca.ET.175.01.1.1]TGT22155.1 hypothetical protein EN817_28345 [Mesorhizobium sp. M3A.F.Ca.ET.174.01.1.1]TGT56948.1 hypothetical protein EN813_041025 [Mesorhizobium sp. M00.F.Ca.ET.170.01.1.1]
MSNDGGTAPPSGLPAISPRKEGDWMSPSPSPIADAARRAPSAELLISPLAGEMAGRPEGGGRERDLSS